MILITNHNNYVKVDLTAYIGLDSVRHKEVYLMKDKAIDVKLDKNLLFVEVATTNVVYKLDQNGVHGFPAQVGLTTPVTNADLALQLAELKNL